MYARECAPKTTMNRVGLRGVKVNATGKMQDQACIRGNGGRQLTRANSFASPCPEDISDYFRESFIHIPEETSRAF